MEKFAEYRRVYQIHPLEQLKVSTRYIRLTMEIHPQKNNGKLYLLLIYMIRSKVYPSFIVMPFVVFPFLMS